MELQNDDEKYESFNRIKYAEKKNYVFVWIPIEFMKMMISIKVL